MRDSERARLAAAALRSGLEEARAMPAESEIDFHFLTERLRGAGRRALALLDNAGESAR